MIKKHTEPKVLKALTPLEEAQAAANLFAVNCHVSHIIQEAVKTLQECETFLAHSEGSDFEALRATVERERDDVLKVLTDMATSFEELFNISA